jgi:spermidine synthase
MNPRLVGVSLLLFGSGACALAYQLVWTRELRLVFGHSTAASAAVLAIFIGGLGAGSLVIGPRADGYRRPLALYARLEALIAFSAAASPLLLGLVRATYLALGGSLALGDVLGTVVRLFLSALVLAVPTLLMGGTLPAAARAVEGEGDRRRRGTALVYSANTLGAVTGAFLTTFVALERFGNRGTLLFACSLNLAVAMIAGRMARRQATAGGGAAEAGDEGSSTGEPSGPSTLPQDRTAPRGFVLAACASVGFAFFLLELVWYRMLSPLLGGTVFTFGLILATALLGISVGGLAYGLFARGRPATLLALSVTCLLEGAAVGAGLALGDRLAVLALLLRPLGNVAFAGHVIAWSTVTAIVVLPPALVAGAQFPLLIALLGRGREKLGRDIGFATGFNTGGAMLGALVGGFGLLPLLTAPGCWRLVAALLGALGLVAAALERPRAAGRLLAPLALAIGVALLLTARGPTAAWRHSGIGAGRADPAELASPNDAEDWLRQQRRATIWEVDGRESAVALLGSAGLAFVVNGKVDGHSRQDAGTQVMSGLVGALLHEKPRRVLVVGLGTGTTAGWLADVPGVERVDVVELEPQILEVARRCAPVNRNALENPRLHVFIGDAREHLLTTRERYDLIVSEPSNPYRAGIASLFSREFYRAARERLLPRGLFLQWIQAYEINAGSLRSLYATLASELHAVESWQTLTSDLLLVGSQEKRDLEVPRLRRLIATEPFRSAMRNAWRTESLEGLLARFVAGPALAERLRASGAPLNTDDRNTLEFGFARTLGVAGLLDIPSVREAALEAGASLPPVRGDEYDALRVQDERLSLYSAEAEAPPRPSFQAEGLLRRADAHNLWTQRSRRAALEAWRGQDKEPEGPNELSLVAEVTAEAGEDKALVYIEALRSYQPAEAAACLARLRLRQGRHEEAVTALEEAFDVYRRDPWPATHVMQGALDAALEIGGQKPELAPRLLEALRGEFVLRMLDEVRLEESFLIGSPGEPGMDCARLVDPHEPDVPFTAPWLTFRMRCYARTDDSRVVQAVADVNRFEASSRESLVPRKVD